MTKGIQLYLLYVLRRALGSGDVSTSGLLVDTRCDVIAAAAAAVADIQTASHRSSRHLVDVAPE